MARYQKRPDEAVFEEIFSRFLRPALSVARQVLSDASLAEDAVQETFLRVIRGRGRYLASMPFSGWFFTILRNICKDILLRRTRRARAMRELSHCREGSLESFAGGDSPDILAGLPEEARVVLVLKIVHGLSFREIASALGISEEAAKKRSQRALRQLRDSRSISSFPREKT